MLLAIDIGNSAIKFGIYEPGNTLDRFSVATWRDYEPEELFFDRLRFVAQKFVRVDHVIAASVVPEVNATLTRATRELFKVTPVFVDEKTDFGFVIKYSPPSHVGADRLVSAYAAVEKYKAPVIICSFGTATVVDAVNSKLEFIGGIIAPGLGIMADGLHSKTSLLPKVTIARPEALIGQTTYDAILSGVYNGTVALAEGLIARVSKEMMAEDPGHRPKVVATGGFSRVLAADLPSVDAFEDDMVLEGLRSIAAKTLK